MSTHRRRSGGLHNCEFVIINLSHANKPNKYAVLCPPYADVGNAEYSSQHSSLQQGKELSVIINLCFVCLIPESGVAFGTHH